MPPPVPIGGPPKPPLWRSPPFIVLVILVVLFVLAWIAIAWYITTIGDHRRALIRDLRERQSR